MIPLVTVDEIRQAERSAIETGRSEADLMLAAGTAIADELHLRMLDASNALILCGPGNNGGDGVVVASRLIEHGWNTSVWTFNRDGVAGAPVDESAAASINWIDDSDQLSQAIATADIVVDAVFGAGSRAELPGPVREAFSNIAAEGRERYLPIWAVDVPSGTDCDTGEIAEGALEADVTSMIGLPKVGVYQFPAARFAGEVQLIDIGLSAPNGADPQSRAQLLTALGARRTLPRRRAGLHKRSAGQLLVVGGAPNYYGAPRMAAEAGLRSGSGLVSVAAPSSIIGSMATAIPELVFVPLPVAEHLTAESRMADLVRDQFERTDALVIGPGLGTDRPVPGFLSKLFGFERITSAGIGFGSAGEAPEEEVFSGRAVLDADTLNWLATKEEWWKKLGDAELVLTPHPGELARLLDRNREEIEADPWQATRDAAARFGQVVVLKYGHSVVATPDGALYVSPQAPPSLATAGTGDVLSGIIGSLLAQGLSTTDAACTGLVLGVRAAEMAGGLPGAAGMTAGDLIKSLPEALESIEVARNVFE